MSVSTRIFNEQDPRIWDDYVLKHPGGTPFHLLAWKRSIEETFGFEPLYLAAWQKDQLCGVLPLFVVENLLMGRALISSPYAVYGGVLADSAEIRAAMAEEVREIGVSLGVRHVELRNLYADQVLGFHGISRYATFTQRIGPDEEEILNAIPRKTRYMVRKALKENLRTVVQTSEFGVFEDLYSKNLRRLGTPNFPSTHFERLLANFQGMVDIRQVMCGNEIASAVMTFYFRDQILPYYGASDARFNAIAPNNFMYFDLMRWGGQHGYKIFDFGRSKKGIRGSYDFKSHWGMEQRDLPYEILLVNRKTLPNYSPTNSKFHLSIKLWQRLPLPVTRAIGPSLIRLVP